MGNLDSLTLPAALKPPEEIEETDAPVAPLIPPPQTAKPIPRRYSRMLGVLLKAQSAIENTGRPQVILVGEEKAARSKRFELYRARSMAKSELLDNLRLTIVETTEGWGVRVDLDEELDLKLFALDEKEIV